MSHFDDIEPLFWGNGPGGGCGALVFVIVTIVAIAWAISADHAAKQICESHGERYVDSRAEYTLCEKQDGTVVRR